MSTYYVMAPADLKNPVASPREADRLVFIADRFSWLACIFSLIWIVWHRLWLVLIGYLAVTLVLEAFAAYTDSAAPMVAGLMVAILFGFEANGLRRWCMQRAGWQILGLVSGSDQMEAELRFFQALQKSAGVLPPVPDLTVPVERPSGIIPRIGSETVVGLPLGGGFSR